MLHDTCYKCFGKGFVSPISACVRVECKVCQGKGFISYWPPLIAMIQDERLTFTQWLWYFPQQEPLKYVCGE